MSETQDKLPETGGDQEKGPEPAPAGPAVPAGPTTPSLPTVQPADAHMGEAGKNEEERLDEALQETMTTSDPVSIKIA